MVSLLMALLLSPFCPDRCFLLGGVKTFRVCFFCPSADHAEVIRCSQAYLLLWTESLLNRDCELCVFLGPCTAPSKTLNKHIRELEKNQAFGSALDN